MNRSINICSFHTSLAWLHSSQCGRCALGDAKSLVFVVEKRYAVIFDS
ncbi:Uncharacterised protein [Vibrio cholerae]|nr:Uncharacterised protein [Vibrio cholerae]CSI93987.1 Uncharacterised protein [Vibrio cholerae]